MRKSGRWRNLGWGLLSLVLLLLGGLLVMGFWHKNSDPETIAQHIDSAKPYLALWRYSLMVAIVAGWKPIAKWLTRKNPDDMYEVVLAYRWKMALWLIVLELVLVQNILSKIVGLL